MSERNVRELHIGRVLLGPTEHSLRQVDSKHSSRLSDFACCKNRRRACACSYVKDSLAGLESRHAYHLIPGLGCCPNEVSVPRPRESVILFRSKPLGLDSNRVHTYPSRVVCERY